MRAIQEHGGGRLTLIAEDVDDISEIQLLCQIADVIRHGGEINIRCPHTDQTCGLGWSRPQRVDEIEDNLVLARKRKRALEAARKRQSKKKEARK